MAIPEPLPILTPRQLEVLELLAKGLTNAEIGSVLGISAGTAKVHVSRVIAALDVTNRTEAAVALKDLHRESAPEDAAGVPGFGERPAIAVLPFDNLGDDPAQDHFAEGLVEDLTTQLAGWRWFPVIARNSSFAVRERQLGVLEIGRELGARYVVEGSTRRHGDRVRINVQLIDACSDAHVFAEKYDRQADDLFAVQDEIVSAIVGALEPTLLRLEGLRALRSQATSIDAWSCFQRGMAVLQRQASEYAQQALDHFDEAIRADDRFPPAHVGRAMALFAKGVSAVGRTHEDPSQADRLAEALQLAGGCFQKSVISGRRAIMLDPLDAAAHLALGSGLAMVGQGEPALAAFERAVELNPSSALACFSLANLRVHTERAEEATALFERAIRLAPHDPNRHHFEGALAGSHLRAGRYEDALRHAQRSVDLEPESAMSYLPLIPACLAHLGRQGEAREAVARVRERWPDWNLGLVRMLGAPETVERIIEGYRLAGWDLGGEPRGEST